MLSKARFPASVKFSESALYVPRDYLRFCKYGQMGFERGGHATLSVLRTIA